jgi:hypothetical protein
MKKSTKNKLRRIKYLLKWNLQSKLNNIKPYTDLTELEIGDNFKCLILVPHADDEWIGNSQVLLKTKSTVYYFQFLGNNYNESNKELRLNELKELQKEINFDLIVSNSYDDYTDLEQLILNNNFTDVFIPYPIDWHKEHIKVNSILQSILSELKKDIKLNFYHISVPFAKNVKGNFLSLSKSELINKSKIFSKMYKSQYNTPISRLNYQLRINGIGKGVYACENFSTLSFEQWKSLLDYVNDNYDSKIHPLIHQIDDLILIRKLSNQIYDDWENENN